MAIAAFMAVLMVVPGLSAAQHSEQCVASECAERDGRAMLQASLPSTDADAVLFESGGKTVGEAAGLQCKELQCKGNTICLDHEEEYLGTHDWCKCIWEDTFTSWPPPFMLFHKSQC
eukprot:CAMPEP_0172756494 /NCGR_PEP_ID=MMETSP1074-20121228/161892_1 /TAXON_ID=2916 /ORGANISM="Ceratium fusus, Strain PA161109" /LENGTH=116 /DNA_ID=CAMNT_0013589757 /DNA_START=61 /DNA_END=408 /DNA_ORIENTATION=+